MTKSIFRRSVALALAGAAPVLGWASPARAAPADRQSYDFPAQPLGAALHALSMASGRDILTETATVAGRQAPALRGRYRIEEALDALLAGSGLRFRLVANAYVIVAGPADGGPAVGAPEPPDIVVTGSRIRGAAVASPTITLARETIEDRGEATLPDALKSIPQNFGGGQNPGIGLNVPQGSGFDLGGGSSINLRGLGSDATLTLLDGHRLSYSAVNESVDISGIPLGAVGHVDIVPDGASALFGSDAIAGVANIVLRRDLDGVETGVRLAGSTDGGDFSQIYSVTAGKSWAGGNLLLAYEYGSNTPIFSNQRDYAAVHPNLTIYPGMHHHSAVASAHEDIGANLSFSVDGMFDERWSSIDFPLNPAGDLSVSRAASPTRALSFGAAPTLTLTLPSDWQVSLGGSYGQDKVDYDSIVHYGATALDLGSGTYTNREGSVEASGNGAVFALPGGNAKLAVGTGYRHVGFVRFTGVGGAQNIDRSQADFYGFGELSLPVVRGVVLSAAARYENYRAIGQVTTPKLGAIVSPTPDVSLKGSWGTSFRAPTLYDQYQPQTVSLETVASLGGSGYPAGKTALLLTGGNPDLKPEKSTNWSATISLHPRAVPGLSLDLSYVSVAYRDRIVTPLPTVTVALANPLYASRVTANPSAAAQAALIAGVSTFQNISGASFDPSQVVAIVDDSSVNAGRQTVHGLDALARYARDLGPGKVSGSLDLAYLTSTQQIGPGLPVTRLAGTIFNPPHVRLRGDVSWSVGPVTVSGAVDYIGPVDDDRTPDVVRVGGMTPVDLTVRYRPTDGPLKGLDLIASVQNVFNAKPAQIATTSFTDSAYDSTNYSPVGRLVSLSVSKSW